MSLVVDISAPKPGGRGYEHIASMEIRCLDKPGDNSRKTDGLQHGYKVTLDGREAGQVSHRYDDGKWKLIAKAVSLVVYREDTL